MYNYDQYADLIKRVRKLPKLGQSTDGINADQRSEAETEAALNSIARTYLNSGDAVELYKKQIEILAGSFGNLQHGLSVITTQQEAYNTSIVNLVKEVTYFDQIEASLAKTLKITTDAAYVQTQTYGTFLEKLNTTRASLDKYRITLDSILPGQSANIAKSEEYAQTLIGTQQHLQDFQGLTQENAAAYTLYTEGAGKNIITQLEATQQLAKDWEAQTGLVGQYNVILTEISSMAADIRSEYSRTNGELELSVLKTKRLGMSMAQLDKIGTGLLNIEESVGQEIEFQLISGKRLVDAQGQSITNKFREAKLTGDSLKMTEAMTDVITEQGEIITGNNFLAKKALADTLGLSVQELVVAKNRYELNKKLQATGKFTGNELDELTPESAKKFQAALEHEVKIAGTDEARNAAKENLAALQKLQKDTGNLESPAQKSERHLQNIVDNGIFIKMPKTTTTEKGKTTTSYDKRPEFDVEAFAKTIKAGKTFSLSQNDALINLVGKTQTLGKVVSADKVFLNAIADITPGFSTLSSAVDNLSAAIKTAFPKLSAAMAAVVGGILPAQKEGKAQTYQANFPHGPASLTTEHTKDLSIDANGGPIVMSLKENRIFQGTKNDDVAMYPGAVDVATANNTTKNYNVTNNTEKVNYDKIGNTITTALRSELEKSNNKPNTVVNNNNIIESTNYNKIGNIVETALQSQLGKLNIKPNITINNTDTNKVVNTDTKNLERIVGSIQTELSKLDIKPNIIINNVEANKNNIDSINNNNKIENTIRTAIQTEISKINIKPNINVSSNKNIDYTDKLEKIATMFETAILKFKSTPDTNTIVSEIKTAFAGVEISVNVDPVKIGKEIKFRDTRINS